MTILKVENKSEVKVLNLLVDIFATYFPLKQGAGQYVSESSFLSKESILFKKLCLMKV
jgi:hypothetical protein